MDRPKPIKPRQDDALKLERLLKKYVVRPLFRQLFTRLSGLPLSAALALVGDLSRTERSDGVADVPFEKLAKVFDTIQTRH